MNIIPFKITIALFIITSIHVNCSEKDLEHLMDTLEGISLSFRDEVEYLYGQRCGVTKEACAGEHYGCISELPGPICKAYSSDNEMWEVAQCVEQGDCGSLWDYTESSVRVPEDVGGEDPEGTEVIETICYTKLMDDLFKEEYEKSQNGTYGDFEFRGMYFGAWNGVFRIYPGRAEATCNVYDPRYRPWYVAASSGPKNVIIIIDTSGSMESADRLTLAKDAAIDVIGTLTMADYVGVVGFDDDSYTLVASTLLQANAENKEQLVAAVEELDASGWTNFVAAFEEAFSMLGNSVSREKYVDCETAILFLTDGYPTAGEDDEESIVNEIEELNSDYGATIFTYSLGSDADSSITKSIACNANGIWQYVPDGGNLREKMSGFYHYYAAGMGRSSNQDFTAWVEPYSYATGTALGTTVSAPVYDRSTTPFRFLGSVGIDMPVTYMEEVVGGSDAYGSVLAALTAASQSFCPSLDLSECQLQSLRDAASYDNDVYSSVCDNQCSYYSDITPEACLTASAYPDGYNLWVNTDYDGDSYEVKACCIGLYANDSKSYDQCPSGSGGLSDIELAAAIVVPILVCFGWCCVNWFCRRKKKNLELKGRRSYRAHYDPKLKSTEYEVTFQAGDLGLRIEEGEEQGVKCSIVSNVTDGGQAAKAGVIVGSTISGLRGIKYISHDHFLTTCKHGQRPLVVRFKRPSV